MQVVDVQGVLEQRLIEASPDVRPPAVLLQRLAEAVGADDVQLVTTDLRALGFGAYDGCVCVVTPHRVVLATATRLTGPEGAFGVEQWEREVAPVPRLVPVGTKPAFVPVPPRAPVPGQS